MTLASGEFARARPGTVLMIGPVNSPHIERLALSVAKHGWRVVVGGWEWESLPPSTLPDLGVQVEVRTAPTRRWMRKLARQLRPDVVHVHWLPYAFLAALYGMHPLVATAWGSDFYMASRFWRAANRFVVRRADVIMSDSEALLGDLERIGAPPSRKALFNWGVDVQAFRPDGSARSASRQRLGLPDRVTLLGPRGLRPYYNPDVIVAAFDHVADQLPDVQLVLKHPTSERAELAASRHQDRIHVVGHVAYELMPAFFRSADVCVSIPASDSSPRSVWEAMACGTPCIVSDLPWVHELIRPECHALVVPISEEALAQALLRVLTDNSLQERLSHAGRELVLDHRNEDREVARLLALYDALRRTRQRWPIRRRLRIRRDVVSSSGA